jgi:hypothetical protein
MLPPILGLLIATADDLVELIYTREYLGAVPLMRTIGTVRNCFRDRPGALGGVWIRPAGSDDQRDIAFAVNCLEHPWSPVIRPRRCGGRKHRRSPHPPTSVRWVIEVDSN